MVTKNLSIDSGSYGKKIMELQDAIDGLSDAEIAFLDGVTAGTVTASKGVVVDSNKDIGDFRNVDVVNLDAGASGTAGTVDVFPSTASKGKLAITCTSQTNDTTVTLTAGAMGQATAITIPDPGGATASVVLTEGAQTVNGVKTFGSIPVLPTGGLTVGTTTITETEIGVLDSAANTNAGTGKAAILGTSGAILFPSTFTHGSNATDRVAILGHYMSPANVVVAVPAITDPDIAKVDVDVSGAFSMQPAVGDAVIAIPQEAMEANARILNAYVTNTDQITVVFGSEGGNVTGGNKNFKFLVVDLT